MRKTIRKGASLGCDGERLENSETASINRKSTHAQDKTICFDLHSSLSDGMISITSRKTGRNLGGLFDVSRRLIAMPHMAFSFCALSRTHGVSASICFDGHANWESLTGLLFPVMTVRQPDWCCPPTLGGVVAFIYK